MPADRAVNRPAGTCVLRENTRPFRKSRSFIPNARVASRIGVGASRLVNDGGSSPGS
jgi:hypothetical protein